MITGGAPFRLGAYGWVDAPAPYIIGARRTARSGPNQKRSAPRALVRRRDRGDPARRRRPLPGDNRWKLTLDSAKIRAAMALAERVRLGLHPTKRSVSKWKRSRATGTSCGSFSDKCLADDQQARRVCDGQKVLKAARRALVAGLPADLAAKQPLDEVLDTSAICSSPTVSCAGDRTRRSPMPPWKPRPVWERRPNCARVHATRSDDGAC